MFDISYTYTTTNVAKFHRLTKISLNINRRVMELREIAVNIK